MTPRRRAALDALPRRPAALKRSLALLAAHARLGWRRSAEEGVAVTAEGEPLPWLTYGAIAWLGPRLRPTDHVMELGAGQSTHWLAARVAQVTSVEHDAAWAARVRELAPDHVEVVAVEDPGPAHVLASEHPYLAPLREAAAGSVDVVVVDGRARCSVLAEAPRVVAADGLVLLDNADRPAYRAAISRLMSEGWGRIDWLGSVPGAGRLSVTSGFVRDATRWLDVDAPLPDVGYDPPSA